MMDEVLTPEQFAARMRELSAESDNGDEETAHINADALMCGILRHFGYGDGVAVFKKMGKWYA